MAATEQTDESVCIARLHNLLRRAREVKSSTTIEPPLHVSALITDGESILVPLKPHVTGEEKSAIEARNLAIEGAAKSIFFALLGSTRITEPGFVSVWNLLDVLQYYGDRGLCAPQLVLSLIEELLDSLSLTECRIVLDFLESRRETLIATKGQGAKDLVTLRLCNELLRRQSRAEDPVFCGRVYIFMFQSFPLGDKSSVNLRGHFHVENETTFEDHLAKSTPAEDGMDVDPNADVEEETKSEETDAKPALSEPVQDKPKTMSVDALYPVFWSLQHSFSDPPRLFDESNFRQFKEGLEATLAKFKEVPKVVQSMDSAREISAQEPSDEKRDEAASATNPKYLTSRDLFKLELSDLAFQRHILVQALIMIEFLLTLTEKSKSKPYYQTAQSRMQYDFTLSEENTEWALGIKNAIANYLQDGPDGKFYYRMVDTVLSRDKNWVRWKMRSCKSFTRPRVPAETYEEAKSGAQKAGNLKKVPGPTKATQTLQFLSKTGSGKGLSQLRHNQRTYAESVRELDQDLDLARHMERPEVEISELLEKKTSQTWRGLRLAAMDQLNLFDGFEHGKGLESLLPVTLSSEATYNNAATALEDRDHIPQEELPSVEDQRADQQSQVTATAAEEAQGAS
ncbi:nuclear matrix protein-like protein [Byssothecium circinans]|uniref:Nuclear matrix protein-like protein n=1 Tax=Byssothecium circinans TaxID=147558 RepID=A0A6A5U5A5_9PLEO|nr:nuclear matrix protein-like protein [Byssothecium circinans]